MIKKEIVAFLSDPAFFKKYGFEVCDRADPYYELCCLRFDDTAPMPVFKECAKSGTIEDKDNVVIYYTNQCPFTQDYVRDLEKTASEYGIPLKAIKYESAEMAQNAPVPSTTYSLFQNGKFVTHEVQSNDKFLKLMGKK